jgi:hypothetical protein
MPDDPIKAAEARAPRIFFSYAGEDKFWIDLFRSYFADAVGTVQILDYKADAVPYGALKHALDEQIEHAVVVVAFVSAKYCAKEWTVAEWEKGLEEAQRRRLIFVPIMLDADAVVWWQELRRGGKLTAALNRDYQYSDFSGAGTGYALPSRDNPAVIQKIVKLALAIREDLARTPNPEPPPTPGEDSTSVVVLGHASASLPAELQEQAQELVRALGTGVVTWKDGWRQKDLPRAEISLNSDPIFVQPIPSAEAADYAQDRTRTETYLMKLGRTKPRVTIWLPAKFHDADFEAAKARVDAAASKFPVFRTDDPGSMAKWLRAEIGFLDSADTMIVQVEGFGMREDGSSPETIAATKRIVDGLKNDVWNIVTRSVEKPKPTPPPWQFWDTQFQDQIKILPGSRALVAIHDLDIPPDPVAKTVRKKVELKFDSILRCVDCEQKKRQDNGQPLLSIFWTALLVNNARALPFSNYPSDGRYKDWCLLGFLDHNGASQLAPDPASLAVFRTNLIAWAAESGHGRS